MSWYDVSDPQTESGKQHSRVPKVRQNGAEIHTSWECGGLLGDAESGCRDSLLCLLRVSGALLARACIRSSRSVSRRRLELGYAAGSTLLFSRSGTRDSF